MGAFLASRQRNLRRYGRSMQLARPNPTSGDVPSVLTVQGYSYPFRPDQIAGQVQQGDSQVAILNDEIANAAWPGPPERGDTLTMDGQLYQIFGATGVYEGPSLIGFTLWIRGGDP